jgi:hypothetical protein
MKQLVKPEIRTGRGSANEPCVYRITAGRKFFIWKGKSFTQSIDQVCEDLSRKILAPPEKLKQTDFFYNLVKHMKKHRVYTIVIDFLFSSETTTEVLNFEKAELAKSLVDPDCCNTNAEPYFPKWAELPKITAYKPVKKEVALPEPEIKEIIDPEPEKTLQLPIVAPSYMGEDLVMPEFSAEDIELARAAYKKRG